MPLKPKDRLLTAPEVSALTGRSPATLANDRCFRRGLPFIKIGHRVYYRASAVESVETHSEAA